MLILLLSLACYTSVSYNSATCDVSVDAAEPAEALPGDTVLIQAGPLTEDWDTAVTFGSARATLVSVDRTGCDECDSCRESAGCDACEDCDACDLSCEASCAESITAVVPTLAPGQAAIVVRNSRGVSKPLDFVVLPGDTGVDDSGL